MPLMLGGAGVARDDSDKFQLTTMSIPPSGNTRCAMESAVGDALRSIQKKINVRPKGNMRRNLDERQIAHQISIVARLHSITEER
jgi:hypothetical protein